MSALNLDMTMIDCAYFNYAHGGLIGGNARRRGTGFDFAGLVRVMGEDDRWPNLLVMGEAERYTENGGEGMWGAAAAMRAAGGRPYVPLECSLPREWGPVAPVIFFDPNVLVVQHFFHHRYPDFYARNRNLLIAQVVGGGAVPLYVTTLHGDLYDPALREADARHLRSLAKREFLTMVPADFNETLSGPRHEVTDLNDPAIYDQPDRFHARVRAVRGRPLLPYEPSTGALDYLCGWWDGQAGERVGGVGYVDVAELAEVFTGTNLPVSNGRQASQIDHILVNLPLAERVVPGSVRIHEPLDPARPDSDHKRVSVTVDI